MSLKKLAKIFGAMVLASMLLVGCATNDDKTPDEDTNMEDRNGAVDEDVNDQR